MDLNIVARVDDFRAHNPGATWENMAPYFGCLTGEQLRSKYRRAKRELRDYEEPEPEAASEAIEFLDRKKAIPVHWREIIDLAIHSQKINEQLDDIQRTAEIRINTDKPIGIVFSGDWHLGDGTTDHVQWAKDMNLLLSHERLYLVDLGDDRQNTRSFKDLSAVLSQVLSPKQQAFLLRSIIDELTNRNKLLAKVTGNHDEEFDQRIFGEALQSYLLSSMNAPRFRNRGLIKLTVGKELYTLLLFHKSRFSSFVRGAHGAFREYQLSYPADIVAGAHDHIPAFEILPSFQLAREAGMPFGGIAYLVKVGTYQNSEFGWRYFHNGGKPMNITVALWPDEHRMAPFFSPADAIRFLDTF